MAELYKGQRANCLKNLEKGRDTQEKNKQKRIDDYYLTPKLCLNCQTIINYHKHNKYNFCNHSCAAAFNNKNRIRKAKQPKKRNKHRKQYTTNSTQSCCILNFKKIPVHNIPIGGIVKIYQSNVCVIDSRICKICNKPFIIANGKRNTSRITCSKICSNIASVGNRSYVNGKLKSTYYFNKHQNKEVFLESSWEVKVAEKLDSKNLEWIRPNPIQWVNSVSITKYYYPDFYLPTYNLYLDPKNPYCMSLDVEKMEAVTKTIDVIYGDINLVLNYIDTLT